MSSIHSAPSGVIPQAKSAGANNQGGGGGGGMYFAQEEYYEEEQAPEFSLDDLRFDSVDTGDIPYSRPLLNNLQSNIQTWKTALAMHLYQGLHQKLADTTE